MLNQLVQHRKWKSQLKEDLIATCIFSTHSNRLDCILYYTPCVIMMSSLVGCNCIVTDTPTHDMILLYSIILSVYCSLTVAYSHNDV